MRHVEPWCSIPQNARAGAQVADLQKRLDLLLASKPEPQAPNSTLERLAKPRDDRAERMLGLAHVRPPISVLQLTPLFLPLHGHRTHRRGIAVQLLNAAAAPKVSGRHAEEIGHSPQAPIKV